MTVEKTDASEKNAGSAAKKTTTTPAAKATTPAAKATTKLQTLQIKLKRLKQLDPQVRKSLNLLLYQSPKKEDYLKIDLSNLAI